MITRIDDCLESARLVNKKLSEAANDQPSKSDESKDLLRWLESQLANVIAELEAMLEDIESGLSVFSSDAEFEETMDLFEAEIANLKGRILSLILTRRQR